MNRHAKKIFDELVSGTDTVHTSVEDTQMLSSGRQVGILAVCDDPTGAVSVQLTIAIEHCADGRHFQPKSVSPDPPEIDHVTLTPGATSRIYGGEAAGVKRTLKHARLAINLTGVTPIPFTTLSARIRVYVCVRGSPATVKDTRAPMTAKHAALAAPAGSVLRTEAMKDELRTLSKDVAHLPPQERAAHVLERASPATKEHVAELDRRWRALHPAARQAAMASTMQLLHHANTFGAGGGAPAMMPQMDCGGPACRACGGVGCVRL